MISLCSAGTSLQSPLTFFFFFLFFVTISDGSTIGTLLGSADVLRNVCGLLDKEEPPQNWKVLALEYGISLQECDYLCPDVSESPTKLLVEYISQARPNLTMESFLTAVLKIGRHDVVFVLKEFFSPLGKISYLATMISHLTLDSFSKGITCGGGVPPIRSFSYILSSFSSDGKLFNALKLLPWSDVLMYFRQELHFIQWICFSPVSSHITQVDFEFLYYAIRSFKNQDSLNWRRVTHS